LYIIFVDLDGIPEGCKKLKQIANNQICFRKALDIKYI